MSNQNEIAPARNYILNVNNEQENDLQLKKLMTEEIAKAVNLSPGLMHNKGTGQGPSFVVYTTQTVKDVNTEVFLAG